MLLYRVCFLVYNLRSHSAKYTLLWRVKRWQTRALENKMADVKYSQKEMRWKIVLKILVHLSYKDFGIELIIFRLWIAYFTYSIFCLAILSFKQHKKFLNAGIFSLIEFDCDMADQAKYNHNKHFRPLLCSF